MEKESFQADIAGRFLQIRRDLYGDNNRKMALAIGEDERVVSAICTGKRAPGLTTLLKLISSNTDVDANWLLVGRTPHTTPRPYTEPEVASTAETFPIADGCPWERYDAAQQEIGSLRERLASASATIAKLKQRLSTEGEKTNSTSALTPLEPISV